MKEIKLAELYDELGTSKDGLTTKEARLRLEKNGKNTLPKKKQDSFIKILIRQLFDSIVLLLVVTVFFSIIVKEYTDAIAIGFIILIDLVLGTFQEWRAGKNADSLSSIIKVQTNVIRDGVEVAIDSEDLVVGDVIVFDSGDKISADARIIEAHNLSVNESVLTGESVSVTKSVSDGVAVTNRGLLFAGTVVTTGRAKAVVIKTGTDTEVGKIADKVANTKEQKSPLTIRMEKFSKQISLLVIVIAVIITILLISKNVPGKEIFLSVIALSVSAMPEGLPLALTMALTITSNKMMKQNVIVKKLNSVESLGSCTYIASDKTGTLTVNEQTAKKIILPDDSSFTIEGVGYNYDGKIIPNGDAKIDKAKEIAFLGYINNEADLKHQDGKYTYFGDSIDVAFLALGKKAKVESKETEVIGEIPYESENKFSAAFYKENNDYYCTVKGATEKVLTFCNDVDKERIRKQNEVLAKDGYRVIAVAAGKLKHFKKKDDYLEKDCESLEFKGLVAFIDPIREDAKQSIKDCKTAGINVIMITGDHPLTAFSIAKDLGLCTSYDEVATTDELNAMLKKDEKTFDRYVKTKRVFSRVTPLDKLEIIESLKRTGEFVAVTGDGVNDAPAIKSANIGIAMGSGTDVAKETADMLILDDSFSSIAVGVKEGRGAYSNIRKVSYMLLSCGLAEVLFFCLSIFFNLPMPLVAIQLLWLNIVTDGLQDFALSFEKPEDNIMKEAPRKTTDTLFNKELLSEVLVAGLTIGLIVFGVWAYLIKTGMDVSVARGYIMALMVFMQNIHVLNCRSEKTSAFKISLKKNLWIPVVIVCSIILQIIVMEVPILSKFLNTTSIPVLDMIKLLGFSLIILVVIEVNKYFKRKRLE